MELQHIEIGKLKVAGVNMRHGKKVPDVSDILPSVKARGVLVRGVSGLHSGVNPTSGDFSVGAWGHRICGGELAAPFREATIASTLQRMLLGICGIGATAEPLAGGMSMPPLVIADVALSGI